MRVLVVDDDDASRYLIASLLKGHGHEVVEARDGREALDAGRSMPVDIVVSDVLMPVMDGYTLVRAWKADPALADTPVVFYTASYTEPADRRFAESLGVDGFLVKPQEPDLLVRLIEEAFERRSTEHVSAREAEERDESEVLREYSERLVSKLEQKSIELDKANQDMARALEVISDEIDVKKTLIEQLTNDIRARERVEGDLRAANATLETVIASSPLGIIVFTTDWKVSVWNPAAERLLGWKADDAIGRFDPSAPEGERDAFIRSYAPLTSGELQTLRLDVHRTRADGTHADLIADAAALPGADGKVAGVIAVLQDVTEQRQIEMVKSDFVSMVSHELRTPLTSIIGYGDLLEQIDLREKPELFRQLLGKIRDRGESMRRLIDDLLAVSQIQSGPLRLNVERADVVAAVRAVVDKATTSPRHELVFSADDEIRQVLIDRPRLARAVAHVIDNAVKYSPDGGVIAVDVSETGESVRIAVTDHGIGMEPADMARVFDRFTQADMSDTRSFGGVGVGLYLARQTVEAHGGRIEVESAPGQGSTFTIILPIAG